MRLPSHLWTAALAALLGLMIAGWIVLVPIVTVIAVAGWAFDATRGLLSKPSPKDPA